GVGAKYNFQASLACRPNLPTCRLSAARRFQRDLLRGQARARNKTVVDRGFPEWVEGRCESLSFPIGLHDVVAVPFGMTLKNGEHLVNRFPVIERSDQRLDDGDGAVIGPRLTPGLKIMGFWNMPVAELSRFVIVKTKVHAQLYLQEILGELEVSRRGVRRVRAEDEQDVHLAGFYVLDQLAKRLHLVHGICFDRVRIDHRLAGVAERNVHRMSQGMNGGRLSIARHHDARTAVL